MIFAGEWCLPLGSKTPNVSCDLSEMSEYHWEDPIHSNRDVTFLSSVYEMYLQHLTESLNSYHQVDFTTRSWRLIIGPWLYDFIRFSFDCYSTIKKIQDSEKVSHTQLSNLSLQDFIPQSYEDFHVYSSDSLYNHVFFGEIIKRITLIPYSTFTVEQNSKIKQSSTNLKDRFLRLIKYSLAFAYSNFPFIAKHREIVFVSSYFSTKNLLSLQRCLRQLPMPFLFDPMPMPKRANVLERKKIIIDTSRSEEFFRFLDALHKVYALGKSKSVKFYRSCFFFKNIFFHYLYLCIGTLRF